MVPGKCGMSVLIIALKGVEIKSETIPVHMHQVQTATRHLKDKVEIPTVELHVGKINKTTTLFLPT